MKVRVRSQVTRCEICGAQSGTVTVFFPITPLLPCQYHSTDAPHSFPSTCCSYQKDKRVSPGNIQTKSALTEFGGRWIGKRFYLLFKYVPLYIRRSLASVSVPRLRMTRCNSSTVVDLHMNCISRRPYPPQQLLVSRGNTFQKLTDIQPTKCLPHQKDILPLAAQVVVVMTSRPSPRLVIR